VNSDPKVKATGRNNRIVLETERLLLREFLPLDADSFYFLNKDKDVMQYTGDRAFETIQESRVFIENYDAYQKTGMGRWTVVEKATGEIIGWCGLKKHSNEMIDLGYRFHKLYWNQGYATEASRACLDYGWNSLKLHCIIGRTAADNLASIRVLEKIGMTFWKKAPCEGIENSVYYRIYST